MKRYILLLAMCLGWSTSGQELANFHLEPNGVTNSVRLHTAVYRSSFSFFDNYAINNVGNEITVSLCYNNTSSLVTTFDQQEIDIALPSGSGSYILNIEVYGDGDGVPCSNTDLIDMGSINFSYPYNPIATTSIPDFTFEDLLESINFGDDITNNDLVFTHRIENVAYLFLNGQIFILDGEVSDMTGIENFSNLKVLRVNGNSITQLDLSANPNLIELNCSQNPITNLNVSNNFNLETLRCDQIEVVDLDLSNNLALERLECFGCEELLDLDVTNNINLKLLLFNANNLTAVDLTQNTDLIELHYSGSNLQSIDISQNLNLVKLKSSGTQIIHADLGSNPSLQEVEFSGGALQTINVSNLSNLVRLELDQNDMTSIDLSSNTQLETVVLLFNDLTSVDLRNGNNTGITTLFTNVNPNLFCIDVDNPSEAPYPNWNVDSQTGFSKDCSLGIVENTKSDAILFFPNPVGNTLTISTQNNIFVDSIRVFDVLGREMFETVENVSTLDMSHLNDGIYLVNVQLNGETVIKKIVKN